MTSFSSNIFLNSLLWDAPVNPYGRLALTFSFGGAGAYNIEGDKFTGLNWNASSDIAGQVTLMNGDVANLGGLRGDQASTYLGLQIWASVTNLHFDYKPNAAQTDIKFMVTDGRGMQKVTGYTDVLGVTWTADQNNPSYVLFDKTVPDWTRQGLLPGGSAFNTILHEIGHTLGLDHPFNDDEKQGDGSPEPYFPGSDQGSYGDYGLNQGIFTVMSYNDGYFQSGFNAGLGAFDIAAAQALYGVNTTYHAKDDTYVLPLEDGACVGWMCLWDTGGTDTISASKATGSVEINLRAASLQEGDPAAGGSPSYADGVAGGFTIANGVIIENAIGGSGDDWLRGNEYNNRLEGGKGNDLIVGGCGADTIIGGDGADTFWFKNIQDFHDKLGPGGKQIVDNISDFAPGVDKLKFQSFDADPTGTYSPVTFVFIGNSAAFRKDGSAQLMFSSKANSLFGDVNGDGVSDFTIKMTGVTSLRAADFIL